MVIGGCEMIRKTYNIDDDGVIFGEKEFKYTVFDAEKGYLFRQKNYYVKSYQDIKLSDVVTNENDFAKVHKLAERIYKDTNIIFIRVNSRNVRVADIEDISKILDVCVRKAREFMNRMKKLHVIAERIDNVGEIAMTKFVFNPLFFNSKKYISPDLYFLFQESLDKNLPYWAIKRFHELGNIKNDTK